eukprot:comp24044_c1_seq1/m.43115 comp24044_c1_seq1/g.43115  ORF comp24044_c1_seq1/g.43115 comp24044_c1_seq1/m.43115 type:complete len:139 (-) comp24044_c1_seq1:543-959(-)
MMAWACCLTPFVDLAPGAPMARALVVPVAPCSRVVPAPWVAHFLADPLPALVCQECPACKECPVHPACLGCPAHKECPVCKECLVCKECPGSLAFWVPGDRVAPGSWDLGPLWGHVRACHGRRERAPVDMVGPPDFRV